MRDISTHITTTAAIASSSAKPKLKPHNSSKKNAVKNTHAFLSVLLLTHLRLNLTVHGLNCNFIIITIAFVYESFLIWESRVVWGSKIVPTNSVAIRLISAAIRLLSAWKASKP